jgi:ATP-binding cassette, subfamily B, bacterial
MQHRTTITAALRKLNKLILADKRDVFNVYLFAVVGGIISLSLPLGIQTIVSFVMATTLSTSIIVLIAIVIGGVILNGFVQIRQMQVIERIRQKIFSRYTLEFADKIPKISLENMDDYYLPEVVNRFFDISSLAKSIEKLLIDIPTALMQIFLGLLLLSFYHPLFIAFGALIIFILVIILRVTSPRGFDTSMLASDYKYQTGAWLEEVARSSKTFRYSKGTEIHMEKSDGLLSNYLTSRTSHFKILIVQFWSLISFKILIIGTMLIVGTWLLLDQQLNVGQFIAADIVILLVINSVEKLIANMDNVYDSLTSIEKLSKIVDGPIEQNGTLKFDNSKGCKVQFEDVSFNYPDGSKGLTEVSFNLNSKEVICIAGSSGSGRSTIMRLLTGAYNAYTGSILLNNIPLANYNIASLRGVTGAMFNEQDIFRGSILDNITMGNKNITLDEISYIANKIGIDEFIKENKLGYDTIIDPTGKRLNNHLKQNIKLLRALVGKPSLLILEEPFSHLTDIEKTDILKYIKTESNATAIIISNDDEIFELCDKNIALEHGTIVKNTY